MANITPGLKVVLDGRHGPDLEYDFETENPTKPGTWVRNPENGQVRFDSLALKGAANKTADECGKKGCKNAMYMEIMGEAIRMSQKQFVMTKEREAQALAMGRPIPDLDIVWDNEWVLIAVDISTRLVCRERQVPHGLPKVKRPGDSDSDDGGGNGMKLELHEVACYGFSTEIVSVILTNPIMYGVTSPKDWIITVDKKTIDVLEVKQSEPGKHPGRVDIELNAFWLVPQNAVSVAYKQPKDSSRRLSAAEELESMLQSFPPCPGNNYTGNLYMEKAEFLNAKRLQLTLSGKISVGDASLEDFYITYTARPGAEPVRKQPDEIKQSGPKEEKGTLIFEFPEPAKAGVTVEFRYVRDEDEDDMAKNIGGKPGFDQASGNRWTGLMQNQRGIMIKIPELAGNLKVWKEFYEDYTGKTQQPTPRYATARGTSGHDMVEYMKILDTNREKDRKKAKALEMKKLKEQAAAKKAAAKAAGEIVEEEEDVVDLEECPWLVACKAHYVESCTICWDIPGDSEDEAGGEEEVEEVGPMPWEQVEIGNPKGGNQNGA